jgi:hypothetical protein
MARPSTRLTNGVSVLSAGSLKTPALSCEPQSYRHYRDPLLLLLAEQMRCRNRLTRPRLAPAQALHGQAPNVVKGAGLFNPAGVSTMSF